MSQENSYIGFRIVKGIGGILETGYIRVVQRDTGNRIYQGSAEGYR